MSAGLTKLQAVNQILEAVKEFPVTALDPGGVSIAALAEDTLDRETTRALSGDWHENTENDVELSPPDVSIAVSGGSGTFTAGETVTETTSGATGRFHQIASSAMKLTTLTGTFTGGQTLTGGSSGATKTGGALTALTEGEIVLDANVLRADTYGGDAHRNVTVRAGKLYDLDEEPPTATFGQSLRMTLVRTLTFADLNPETKDYIVALAARIFQRRRIGGREQDAFLREEEGEALMKARRADQENEDVNIIHSQLGRMITGRRGVWHPPRENGGMKNAQLWKRILNEGLKMPPGHFTDGTSTNDWAKELEQRIIRAPIIVDARSLLEEEEVRPNHPVGLPFPRFWTEGSNGDGASYGAMVMSLASDEGWEIRIIPIWATTTTGNGPIVFGMIEAQIDRAGCLVDQAKLTALANNEDAFAMIRWVKNRVWQTLNLLNCSNVHLKPHESDPAQAKRATRRFGDTPHSYRYHTLVVRPAGTKSDSPGIDIGTMPRHVCRGHFAHYGPASISGAPDGIDRGLLFGRIAGKFYLPQSIKGDPANGTVEKDYEVRPLQPTGTT